MDYDVYLSCCKADFDIARQLKHALYMRGLKTYIHLENKLFGGIDYSSQIVNAIQHAKVFLCVYSTNSAMSQWQHHEIDFACDLQKEGHQLIILPVIVGGGNHVTLPSQLLGFKAVEYNGNPEAIADGIADALKRKDGAKGANPEGFEDDDDESPMVNEENAPTASMRYKRKGSPSKIGRALLWSLLIIVMVGLLVGIFLLTTLDDTPVSYEEPSQNAEPSASYDIKPEFSEPFNGNYHSDDTPDELYGRRPEQIEPQPDETMPETVTSVLPEETSWWIYVAAVFCGIGLGVGSMWLYRRFSRPDKSTLKVKADRECALQIDGEPTMNLLPKKVEKIQLDHGSYIVDFIADAACKSFTTTLLPENGEKAILCKFNDEKPAERRIVKCFIAGSTKLSRERDALRATMSVMYNKWEKFNFSILSYTYEDFQREVADGGQQSLYDKFITTEADIAVFIFDREVGEITKSEFQKAYDSFLATGHPKILIYAKEYETASEEMTSINQLVNSINQYWISYRDIDMLKLSFENYCTWMLMKLYKKELIHPTTPHQMRPNFQNI